MAIAGMSQQLAFDVHARHYDRRHVAGSKLAKYLIKLSAGQSIHIEDDRALAELASTLCQEGFVQVKRLSMGYQAQNETNLVLFERAVVSIEPS